MVLGRFQKRSRRTPTPRPAGPGGPAASPPPGRPSRDAPPPSRSEISMVMAIVGQNPAHVSLRLGIRGNASVAVDGRGAGVVRGDRALHVAVAIEHGAQVAGAGADVVTGLERILEAEV